MSHRSRFAAIVRLCSGVLVLALVAAACGSGSDGLAPLASAPGSSATALPAVLPTAAPLAEVPATPNLELLGQGSLEGKDIVVYFWATW